MYGAPGVLLVYDDAGGCSGTRVSDAMMTEVGRGVGVEVGTVVVGVGVGVGEGIVVGTVVGMVVGGLAGTVVTVVVTGRVVRPAAGVMAGEPVMDAPLPVPPASAEDAPASFTRPGRRKSAPAARRIRTTTTPAARTTRGMPAGPVAAGDGAAAGISGTVAPQLVQNFWEENWRGAPHAGQNRGGMIVGGYREAG